MSLLNLLVAVAPNLARKKTRSDDERNVLRVPIVTPAVRHDAILRDSAGAVTDTTLPERVSVFLGPGATFEGLADTLIPLYDAAAAGGGPSAPTIDDLARALVVYNKDRLPTSDWSNHAVGLRLTLPVEIDRLNGEWIVDADAVRALALTFVPTWLPRLRTQPTPLPVPDPFLLDSDAVALDAASPTVDDLALTLWERALRNPFECVLPLYATLRALSRTRPDDVVAVALAMLGTAVPSQAALLAGTSAGNAILRRLAAVLKDVPAGADPRLADARKLLDDALFELTPAGRVLVTYRELPLTLGQRVRAGEAQPVEGAATDPPGGVRRLVLGRDLAIGRPATTTVAGKRYTGHAFAGRVPLDPFLVADEAWLNPTGNSEVSTLLTLLSVGRHLSRFDAVRAQGPELLTVGIDAWSVGATSQLPALLFDLKELAADEFDLFFGLHGLDVERIGGTTGQFRVLRIGPDGQPAPIGPPELLTFLGGTVGAGGAVTIAPDWAVRFRFAALVSLAYRRVQVLRGVEQLRVAMAAPAMKMRLRTAAFSPFPTRYPLDFDVTTSDELKKLVDEQLEGTTAAPGTGYLDGHRPPPAARARRSADTLAGALVDLSKDPAKPAYAGFEDDETFYVGSLAKLAPLYVAFELRFRLQKLIDDVKADIPDLTVAGWEAPILREVREVWFRRIAKGFPGLDTGPGRMPKLDELFEFDRTGLGKVDFRKGPATDAQVDAAGDKGALTDRMKFHQWLRSMTLWSHNRAASFVIDAIGLPYINSVLREGGFFDPATRRGIWMSANYALNGDWKTRTDFMPLSARGRRHYKETTNFPASARQVAHLLTLLARKDLFDGDDPTCDEMLAVLKKKVLPTVPGMFTFVTQALEAAPGAVVLDEVHSKIGVGDPAPTGLIGMHDCAIVERHVGAKVFRYVVVFLGGYLNEEAVWHGFVKQLDGCIVTVNP